MRWGCKSNFFKGVTHKLIRYPDWVHSLPSVSKRVLHKLTFALRVNSVEKPNTSVNFSNSIHNNSGVTVPEVLQSNWIVEFCIHVNIVKFWAFWLFWEGLKRFCYESVITLSWLLISQLFFLHVALWLVERMTDIFWIVSFSQPYLSSWLLFLLQSYFKPLIWVIVAVLNTIYSLCFHKKQKCVL